MNEDPVYLINAAIVECVGREMPGVANSVMRALAAANIELCTGWEPLNKQAKELGEIHARYIGPDFDDGGEIVCWDENGCWAGSEVDFPEGRFTHFRHIAPPVQSDE